MSNKSQFGLADYLVFIGMLLLSVGIGVFYAFKDRKNNSLHNYYFGGKKMSPVLVGLSLSVTFISSITVLGYPNHAYVYGTVVLWFGFAATVQVVIACLYYIPLYHRLKVSSIYEYLELRYHIVLRKMIAFTFIFKMTLFMGVTLYLTALSLNAITPIPITWSIIVTASVCTFYSSFGGMKAVVWADAFQAIVMGAGSIAVLVKTTLLVGGFRNINDAIQRGHRNTILNFDPDPTLSHTFWTIFVGIGLTWTNAACANQALTQRYVACKNIKDARIASIISAIPISILLIVAALNGVAMYAYYEGCDPFSDGRIKSVDQTVTLLVTEIFHDTPGMAGLFVAAACSGMLSTVSSTINAISAVLMEDFIILWKPTMKETTRVTISKMLGVTFGVTTTATAFLAKSLNATVVQIAVTLFGLLSGPTLGIYSVGIFLPWTNTIGACVGMICGLLMAGWVTVGGLIYGPNPEKNFKLPLLTNQCPVAATTYNVNTTETTNMMTNTALSNFTETSIPLTGRPVIADTVYSLSYLYIGCVGFSVTCVVAVIISFATGKNNPKEMNPDLFVPFIDNKYLPGKVRKFFRFGVPDIKKVDVPTEYSKSLINKAALPNDNETTLCSIKLQQF